MKSSYGKLFVAALVCAGFCAANLTVRAEEKKDEEKKEAKEKKEQITVTGAAKAVPNKADATKKHLELTDSTGATYMLFGHAVKGDAVAQFDGKSVKATGTTREKDGKKVLFVSAIEEAK